MSRLTGSDAKSLMEAYADVYSDQGTVDEQSQVLGKKGEDWYAVTKDASGKKTGEKKLDPSEVGPKARRRYAQLRLQQNPEQKPEQKPKPQYDPRRERLDLQVVQGGNNSGYRSLMPKPTAQKGETAQQLQARTEKWQKSQDLAKRLTQQVKDKQRAAAGSTGTGAGAGGSGGGSNVISAKNIAGQQQKVTVGRQYAATLGGEKGNVTYDASGKRTFTRNEPAEASKPEPAGQTGDKAKDMATLASTPANKGLAAAAAEKERIRGTQQTDNPLMKDMRSRLPMRSPSVQSPDVAKLGSGNQSLVSNPNAFKAATPTQAIEAAPSKSPTASGSVTTATSSIASTPRPTPVAPKPTPSAPKPNLQQTIRANRGLPTIRSSYEYDAYDLVLEYLFSQGHVESLDEALYVMMEMDSETIQSICKR